MSLHSRSYDADYLHGGSTGGVVSRPSVPRHPHHDTYLNGLRLQQIPEDAFDLPPLTVPSSDFRIDPLSDPNSYKGSTDFLEAQQVAMTGKLNALVEGEEITCRIATTMAEDEARAASALTPHQAQQAFFNSQVFTPEAMSTSELVIDTEYEARFTGQGKAILVKTIKRHTTQETTVASFETYADAETAAQALNEHCGY